MCLSLCDSSWLTVIVPSRSFGKTNCRMSSVSCTHLSEKKRAIQSSFWQLERTKKYTWEGWTPKVSYYCSQILAWSLLLTNYSATALRLYVAIEEHQRSRCLNSNRFCCKLCCITLPFFPVKCPFNLKVEQTSGKMPQSYRSYSILLRLNAF